MADQLNPNDLFSNLDETQTTLVAVSGGSDSIGLLMLAHAWSQLTGAHLQAITVDHGLRAEAAAEAAFVAGVCEAIGVAHVTLAWEGMKPTSGVANAARNARYRLIEEFAGDVGARQLIVGHTADDQAETVLMRNARSANSTSGRGLSGMASQVLLPQGTMLHRPLLGITRSAIRDYLKTLQQSWIEDPTNDDETYERVRVRKVLNGDEKQISQICRFAELAGRQRRMASGAVSDFLMEHLDVLPGLVFRVPLLAIYTLQKSCRTLLVQVLVAIAGGNEHFVSQSSASQFFQSPDEKRMTLGGAIVERHGETLRVYREVRNLPTISVAEGEEVVWDGRLRISNNAPYPLHCGPLGHDRLTIMEKEIGEKLSVKPRAALNSSPVVYGGQGNTYLPFITGSKSPDLLAFSITCPAIEHFCPSFDFPFLALLEQIKAEASELVDEYR